MEQRRSEASGFVLDDPGGLSARAQRFLAAEAVRVPVDPGLPDSILREQMKVCNGEVDEEFLRMLRSLQRRYSGLRYKSGYFDGGMVTYSPSFDPEPGEPLEICYAVETGTNVGASVTRRGEVEIGFDDMGSVDFGNLDQVIESDSMFALVREFPLVKKYRVDVEVGEMRSCIAESDLGLVEVPEASGRHSCWFLGDGAAVFYSSLWHVAGFPVRPEVEISATDASAVVGIESILWSDFQIDRVGQSGSVWGGDR